MTEKVFFVILGAAIAIISSWVKAWIDRETAISTELLKQRIQALNDIWICFMKVKNTYAHKISIGHTTWLQEYKDQAQNDINAFREEVDKNQIVLPHEIVEALRDIDTYMFGVLGLDNQKPSEYLQEIDKYLNKLSEKTNSVLGKRTHTINLRFRT